MIQIHDKHVAVKLAEHNKEIGSLKHRLRELEEQNESIHSLALSVKELAVNMQNMHVEQERQNKAQELVIARINALEESPAKKWNNLEKVIITALVSGIITYMLSNIL